MTNAMLCLVRNTIGSSRRKRSNLGSDDGFSFRRSRRAPPAASAKCVEPNARASAFEYIHTGRWQLLRNLLVSVERADAACSCAGSECSHDLAEEDPSAGRTMLHEVCGVSKPPVDVVRTILRMFSDMVAIRDDGGRCPLHLAVESEASMNVLRNLVKANPDCAEVRDGRGRTALTLACERTGGESSEGTSTSWGDAEELIEFLLARPSASRFVLLEDEEGRTALEIALMRETPASVVSMLQKCTKKAREEEHRREQRSRRSSMGGKTLKTAVRRLSSLRNIIGSSQAHLVAATSA